MPEKTNHLINEPSLYLQQHAHNPVNWYPWSEEAWDKARKEDKLVLVSIGYSSCHWCHVMEEETFTDSATAAIMNEHYVCIKVDREERPDVDQVYMSAVQLMTGSGGWPLNCFTLPDGRPVYGGTYFPNEAWKKLLLNLSKFYRDEPDKAREYADELTKGISHTELIPTSTAEGFKPSLIDQAVNEWKKLLDYQEGGPNRSPKFPLPDNYSFLLRYATENADTALLDQVHLTLTKMAYGGIYDHLAGGFARYSTDSLWKVPHFEKMLYDNAQLVSLYAKAFKQDNKELYRRIARQTIDFLKRDMSNGKGGYYSAFDADSEGEEGKYYVWKKDEIKNIGLPGIGKANGYDVFADYFNVNDYGYWEHDNYILLRRESEEVIAKRHGISVDELNQFIDNARTMLLKVRAKRTPPALDKKIITSWNAMQVSALCESFEAFGEEELRNEAILTANYLLTNNTSKDGRLLHLASQKEKMETGYLEDYAFSINALLSLYRITFDEQWINKARQFADEAVELFYDKSDGFFWYTSNINHELIARKKELFDNVIPASNSEMANALFLLGKLTDHKPYITLAEKMVLQLEGNMERYPSSSSNWMNLYTNFSGDYYEVVIAGKQADEKRMQLTVHYLPGIALAGSKNDASTLPLIKNRYVDDKTLLYVCRNYACMLPVEGVDQALSQLNLGEPVHRNHVE